ncbi:MAG: SurA N-terminal domain-containing protein, partial [Proteobacteria bacterium]|nr:SurA N-terminal domain-containing protein [Pseudomonadota bacterium]
MMKSVKAVLMGVTAAVFMSLSAQASVADRIVAVVNDEVITLSELNGAFDPYRAKLEAAYQGQEREKALTEARETLLNRMIDALLMQQESRKTGIVVQEEEVTEAIKDLLAKRNISQEDLLKGLAQEGTTLSAYRKEIRDQLMRIKLIRRDIKSRVAVTDEEIGEY